MGRRLYVLLKYPFWSEHAVFGFYAASAAIITRGIAYMIG